MLDVRACRACIAPAWGWAAGNFVLSSRSTNNVQAIALTCNAPVRFFECRAFPAAAPKSHNQKPTLLPLSLPKILCSLRRMSIPLSECCELLQIAKSHVPISGLHRTWPPCACANYRRSGEGSKITRHRLQECHPE